MTGARGKWLSGAGIALVLLLAAWMVGTAVNLETNPGASGTPVRAPGVSAAFGSPIDTGPARPKHPGPWSHPDALTFVFWSEAAGVPYPYTFAISWEETHNNMSPFSRNPASTALGRFQILKGTAASRCPGLNVATYYGNLACFLKMAREDLLRCRGEVVCAARIHFGTEAHALKARDHVRTLVKQEIER